MLIEENGVRKGDVWEKVKIIKDIIIIWMMLKDKLTKNSFKAETYEMSNLSVRQDEGKWFKLEAE